MASSSGVSLSASAPCASITTLWTVQSVSNARAITMASGSTGMARLQQAGQMARDGTHAVFPRLRLGLGVVVRVGVDVVGVGVAPVVGHELDAGDADLLGAQEALELVDQRAGEIRPDLEPGGWRSGRTDIGKAGRFSHL